MGLKSEKRPDGLSVRAFLRLLFATFVEKKILEILG